MPQSQARALQRQSLNNKGSAETMQPASSAKVGPQPFNLPNDIMALAAYYEACQLAGDALLGVYVCEDARKAHEALDECMEFLTKRADQAVRAISNLEPTGEGELRLQMETLLKHEIRCGGSPADFATVVMRYQAEAGRLTKAG